MKLETLLKITWRIVSRALLFSVIGILVMWPLAFFWFSFLPFDSRLLLPVVLRVCVVSGCYLMPVALLTWRRRDYGPVLLSAVLGAYFGSFFGVICGVFSMFLLSSIFDSKIINSLPIAGSIITAIIGTSCLTVYSLHNQRTARVSINEALNEEN